MRPCARAGHTTFVSPAWLVAWGSRAPFPSHLSELVGPATRVIITHSPPPPPHPPPHTPPTSLTGNTAKYAGVGDCFAQTFREGGPRAFYKGFTSNFARLGAWNSAMFVLLEQARAALR